MKERPTIYSSFIRINGHEVCDFVVFPNNGKPRWALQSLDHKGKPCKHYKAKVKGFLETMTLEEALEKISAR